LAPGRRNRLERSEVLGDSTAASGGTLKKIEKEGSKAEETGAVKRSSRANAKGPE